MSRNITTARGEFRAERIDDCLTLIEDPRRRIVLTELIHHYHPLPIYDLVERLLDREELADAGREPLRDDLLEEHLPRMQEAGLVEAVEGERFAPTRLGIAVENTRRGLSPVE